MAQVKKKIVRKMGIVNVWQRTRKVWRRRFRLMFKGAQVMLWGVSFEYCVCVMVEYGLPFSSVGALGLGL
jgi:hypothetical protein